MHLGRFVNYWPTPYPLSGQVRDSVHRPQGAPTSGDRRRVILQDQYRPAERSEGDCDCRSPGGSRSRFPHRSLLRRGAPHELEVAVMQLEVAVIYLQFAQIILHFNAHQDLPGDGGALPLPLLRSLRLPRAYGPLLVRRGVCGGAAQRVSAMQAYFIPAGPGISAPPGGSVAGSFMWTERPASIPVEHVGGNVAALSRWTERPNVAKAAWVVPAGDRGFGTRWDSGRRGGILFALPPRPCPA